MAIMFHVKHCSQLQNERGVNYGKSQKEERRIKVLFT